MSEKTTESSTSDSAATLNSAGTLEEILKQLEVTKQPGKETRSATRYPIAVPIPVIPIDDSGNPVERSFTALSRDISTSGICLQHTRATNAKRLIIVVSIPGVAPARLMVEVVRCRAIGRFYEIAAKFTSRMTEKAPEGAADAQSRHQSDPESQES